MDKHYKVGYVAGMFDIIHAGHIEILKRAKQMCDTLIVAVGTDEFMRWRKKRDSIIPYLDRKKIVESIKYVDMVVPEENLDKLNEYYKYHFDVMFSGDDHKNEEQYIKAEEQLNALGVDVIYIERIGEISSTAIRDKIVEQSKCIDKSR